MKAMSIEASSVKHKKLWTSANDSQLTAWVLETQANLDPNARGIPRKAWEEIAAKIGKTAKACMARASGALKLLNPIPLIWTDKQIGQLTTWVQATRAELNQDGKRRGIPEKKWEEIGNIIGKEGPACVKKARLLGLLDKDLKKHWSTQEHEELERLVKEVQESSESGTVSDEEWKKIAAQLPGRTLDACRCHAADSGFFIPLNRSAWTEEEHHQLKEFVEQNKDDSGYMPENQWPEIAAILHRTPLGCRAQASLRNLLTTISEWTQDQINTLQEWLQTRSDEAAVSTKEWEEVAAKVGRSILGCKDKARRMRKTVEAQQAALAALAEAPFVPEALVANVGLMHLTSKDISEILEPHATQE